MKVFHIGDVLSVTTGRLVSSRHMDALYDILNFLTSDNLHTHQLPRAMNECEPWLKIQFPQLFPDNPLMEGLLNGLDSNLSQCGDDLSGACTRWVEAVRIAMQLPEHLPVYEMGADMHLHIDPIEELGSIMGDIIVVEYDAHDD